jgi:hypothetical protein
VFAWLAACEMLRSVVFDGDGDGVRWQSDDNVTLSAFTGRVHALLGWLVGLTWLTAVCCCADSQTFGRGKKQAQKPILLIMVTYRM